MDIGAVWRFIKHSLRQYSLDNCPQLAAAISYYVLFSIVPLTFVLVSVFGLVIRSEQLRDDVVKQVVDTMGLEPGQVLISLDEEEMSRRFSAAQIAEIRAALATLTADERQRVADDLDERSEAQIAGFTLEAGEVRARLQNTVSDTLSNVADASGPLTVFSLVVSAWAASTMFGAVRRALNIVWKVEYQRPYLQQKVWDLLMVMGFGVFLLSSVVGTGVLRAAREISDEALGPLSTGTGIFWGVIPYIVPGIVSFIIFAFLYRIVPATTVRLRDVWIGALVAAILFEVLKNGFAFYVTHFRSYDLLYGSLGGILLFLTGVFFASSILLVGGELAHATPGLGAGAFAAVHDPTKPSLGLLDSIRTEALKFLRGLILAPRRRDEDQEAGRRPADRPHR